MISKNLSVAFGVLLVACGLLSMSVVATEPLQDERLSKEVESASDVEYTVSLDEKQSVVEIVYKNPTAEKIRFTGYVVRVDEQRLHEENLNLSSGEQRTRRINITDGINVNQDDHTVTFSTFGGHAKFNFTRKIDSADPGKIPTPYIADVEVTEGTIAGEPSSVANVTLVNPSEQLYSTKLMVHTVGTDGSLYPASVRPGDTRTITVELLDDRGAEIAGEARLYTGNMTTKEDALDQVEFAGQDDEQTQVWNTSYEPVQPTWVDDHYQYQNDSYEQGFDEKMSGGYEAGGVPIIYF